MKVPTEYAAGWRWLAACAIAVLVSVALARALCGGIDWGSLGAGWALAVANAVLAAAINRRAVGLGLRRFLAWVFAANALRVLALAGIMVLLYRRMDRDEFNPLLIALAVGYFVFLHGEILALNAGMRDRKTE